MRWMADNRTEVGVSSPAESISWHPGVGLVVIEVGVGVGVSTTEEEMVDDARKAQISVALVEVADLFVRWVPGPNRGRLLDEVGREMRHQRMNSNWHLL